MADPRSVAILGATGHVGKALTVHLADRYHLTLYARRPEAAQVFAQAECPGVPIQVLPMAEFGNLEHHTVVNCVGVGNPAVLAHMGGGIFALTEEFDRITLGYLDAHPRSRLICFSSGAAYGDVFEQPANETSTCRFHMNPMRPEEFYGIAKLASEAKHRAASDKAIVDLRLFGFFSRYIDLDARYLMTDIVRAILEGSTLVTSSEDIVRDYVAPEDLAGLVALVIESKRINDVFDVCSAGPVTKFALLGKFEATFGLSYKVLPPSKPSSPLGLKRNYFSANNHAETLGYLPRHGAIEYLICETEAIVVSGPSYGYRCADDA